MTAAAGNRPSVVIVTERFLYPPLHGYSSRIIELVRSFQELGFRVVLISRRIPGRRARWHTQRLVDELIMVDAKRFPGGRLDAYDCSPFREAIADAGRRSRPVAVIAEYAWLGPCLDAVPGGILKLVDTLDLMHVRGEMYGGLAGGAWVECTRDEEARALEHADVVMAIQPEEQEQFRSMLPDKVVIHVPHPCPPRVVRSWRGRGQIVAFIGSDNRANVRGLEAFLAEGWPLVRRADPRAQLRVYGNVAKHVRAVEGVVLVGPVRSVGGAFARAKVVINPVMLGTGLKIKTVEALAYGRAVVTTSCGAAGLEDGRDEAYLLADEPGAFAAAILRVLRDAEERARLERAARNYAERRFGRRASLAELMEVVDRSGTGIASGGE